MAQRDDRNEYWRRREQAQLEANLREEESYTARLDAQFALLERTIDQLIADFYQRYAAAEGISLADAQQKISRADIEALAEKAKRYVELASQDRKTGSNQSAEYLSKMANDEMRLYNAMMRINRLELLKAEIGMEVDRSYVEMGGTIDYALTKRTNDELRRQAGILGDTVFYNEKDVVAIVNGSFHNATWSERIWNEGAALKSNLDVLLTQGLIAGDNPRELARRLRKTYDVSRYDAERIMRTELARVQTDAQKMSYERNGYEKYMFISTEDRHTCEHCAEVEDDCIEQDGFLVEDMMPGENAPPMHPNCRCSTAAHISEADFEREMMERFGVDMRDEPFTNSESQYIIRANGIERNPAKGTPEGITLFGESLNKRQRELLERLEATNKPVVVKKHQVSMRDLSALTAYTGVEFSAFTLKGKRMIVKGTEGYIPLTKEELQDMARQGYRWTGHTHPGGTSVVLPPSEKDRETLNYFDQKYSVIYNSSGKKYIFGRTKQDDLAGR